MTITSFSYFVFIAIGAIIYYIIPKKVQWVELLVLSIVFYVFAATPYTYIYILISALIAWGVTNTIEKYKTSYADLSECKTCKYLVAFSIVFNVVLWFIIKGRLLLKAGKICIGLLIPSVNSIPIFEFIGALGMGYYTLQIIGYILDCYWGNICAQKNPVKVLIYT